MEVSRDQKAVAGGGKRRRREQQLNRASSEIDQECEMELRKLSGFLFLLFSLILASAIDSHASFFNWGSCLRWRITGICRIVCHNFGCHVWVRVRHWRPDEVSETVNIPGDSIWGESFPGVMASLFDALGGSVPSQAVMGLFLVWRGRCTDSDRSDHE